MMESSLVSFLVPDISSRQETVNSGDPYSLQQNQRTRIKRVHILPDNIEETSQHLFSILGVIVTNFKG